MKITISESILNKLPNFDIIAMSMDVTYQETSGLLLSLINQYEKKIKEEYSQMIVNTTIITELKDMLQNIL